MAKTKKPKETITPSDDLIFQAIAEGQITYRIFRTFQNGRFLSH